MKEQCLDLFLFGYNLVSKSNIELEVVILKSERFRFNFNFGRHLPSILFESDDKIAVQSAIASSNFDKAQSRLNEEEEKTFGIENLFV